MPILSRKPISPADLPFPTNLTSNGAGNLNNGVSVDEGYARWADQVVDDGLKVVSSISRWRLSSQHQNYTVQAYILPTGHNGRKNSASSSSSLPGSTNGSRTPSRSGSLDTASALAGGPTGAGNQSASASSASSPIGMPGSGEISRGPVKEVKPNSTSLPIDGKETWAGRRSVHYLPWKHASHHVDDEEAEENAIVSPTASGSRSGSDAGGGSLRSGSGSDQPRGLFEAFEQGLRVNHAVNEQEYIESLKTVERVGEIKGDGECGVWRVGYQMPAPLHPRTFDNLVLTRSLPSNPVQLPPGFHTDHPPPPYRRFIVITVPFLNSAPMPGKSVLARYASVELVTEVDVQLKGFDLGEIDGGTRTLRGVEWVMVTSSSAGGNVPQAVTNLSLPSKITEDVPAFMEWMEKKFPSIGKVESKRI